MGQEEQQWMLPYTGLGVLVGMRHKPRVTQVMAKSAEVLENSYLTFSALSLLFKSSMKVFRCPLLLQKTIFLSRTAATSEEDMPPECSKNHY